MLFLPTLLFLPSLAVFFMIGLLNEQIFEFSRQHSFRPLGHHSCLMILLSASFFFGLVRGSALLLNSFLEKK